MITDIILNLLYWAIYLFTAPIRLLPNASIPSEIASAVSSIGGYLGAIDFIVPISTIIIILGLFIAIEFAIFSYKVIMWVIRKIPGIN